MIHYVFRNPIAIQNLLKENKKLFNSFPKAKTAKIIKNLIDYVSKIPNTIAIQVELCTDLINWCKEEKRTYLRHRVEIRLANLYALSVHSFLFSFFSFFTFFFFVIFKC